MAKLHIAKGLNLPLDFVTQTQAILAMRRRGKTYTGSVFAEELLKARQQVVVIDITGAWWGLKSSADGKHKGFDIVVAGGEHADLPINPDAGELMAQAITADRFSCILDLKLMRKGQRLRFLASFLEAFHSLNRHPVHVFADEADDYCPQNIIRGEEHSARALGAMDDLVRRGGINGIGCTLISQRPAVINNNVLTQCELLTVLRIIHPADQEPVRKWIRVKATPEQEKDVLAILPSLALGQAVFFAPGWPEEEPIGLKIIQVRERHTFNSSRTPKAGEKIKAPKVLARPDMKKLGERISEIAEQVKANDPSTLRKRAEAAEKALAALQPAGGAKSSTSTAKASAPKADVAAAVRPLQVQIKQLRQGLEQAMKKLQEVQKLEPAAVALTADEIRPAVEQLVTKLAALSAGKAKGAAAIYDKLKREASPLVAKLQALLDNSANVAIAADVPHLKNDKLGTSRAAANPPRLADDKPAVDGIGKAQQRALNSLAWWETIKVKSVTRQQLGAVAQIGPSGGYLDQVLSPLVNLQLITRANGTASLTDAGRKAARYPEDPPDLAGYHALLKGVIKKEPSLRVLDALIEGGKDRSWTRAELGDASKIKSEGGYFDQILSPISAIGVIDRKKGLVTPTALLFPDGLA